MGDGVGGGQRQRDPGAVGGVVERHCPARELATDGRFAGSGRRDERQVRRDQADGQRRPGGGAVMEALEDREGEQERGPGQPGR